MEGGEGFCGSVVLVLVLVLVLWNDAKEKGQIRCHR